MMKAFDEQCSADIIEVDSLRDALTVADNDHATLTDHAELEARRISIHELTVRARGLQAKYEEELAKDERMRDQLAADRRSRLAGGR